MFAAENGGLPGGKVGGMGDVIRELPHALAHAGHEITVVTPAYGFLAQLPGVRELGMLAVPFAGTTETCRRLAVPSGIDGISYELLDHARFTPHGVTGIYHDDRNNGPFATDAAKFAFFSAAAAALVHGAIRPPDVVHLHDWHTALYLLLRSEDPRYRSLQAIRTVLTIHNLALQGIRPLAGDESSLASWFPTLGTPAVLKAVLAADPRYPDCINPMAVGIRLADAVSTVSPTYADEIVTANDTAHGYRGGEGLEGLLAARRREGALVGILNGCEYDARRPSRPGWKRLLTLIGEELTRWIAASGKLDAAAWLADRRLAELPQRRPPIVATSIGRVTEQKLGLFPEPLEPGVTALDRVLSALDPGLFILLGTGDPEYEVFLQGAMAQHPNFLFLKGFSERLSEALYAGGDLFLMPSVFEPCGIGQMLAMRAGQPCVVHSVGGLKDTVSAATGFPFGGDTPREQAENLVATVTAAGKLQRKHPEQWKRLKDAAAAERFTWKGSAQRYLEEAYAFEPAAN